MEIKIDDLSGAAICQLLNEHIEEMAQTSPEDSCHALNIDALKSPDITFFSAWHGATLLGCVALKALDNKHIELKSMRTTSQARQRGVATALVKHALTLAVFHGYQRISLETGTHDYFAPARHLYRKLGFDKCGPFADYEVDPHSCYMTRRLAEGETWS